MIHEQRQPISGEETVSTAFPIRCTGDDGCASTRGKSLQWDSGLGGGAPRPRRLRRQAYGTVITLTDPECLIIVPELKVKVVPPSPHPRSPGDGIGSFFHHSIRYLLPLPRDHYQRAAASLHFIATRRYLAADRKLSYLCEERLMTRVWRRVQRAPRQQVIGGPAHATDPSCPSLPSPPP